MPLNFESRLLDSSFIVEILNKMKELFELEHNCHYEMPFTTEKESSSAFESFFINYILKQLTEDNETHKNNFLDWGDRSLKHN